MVTPTLNPRTAASNVAEALKLISSNGYDVLLSDLHMPGAGDGLTVRPLAGAAELEVSLYGARRCRFARVEGTPPPRQRGL